ncbi:hypothetical protein [Hyalangium sp.]|uniref:hypothetical protein n=1 Tax=Hyalangium sp. TaxID=2028555 RepID=UPI002D2D543A|nr:hypothetical protein [Hyalangium sp.]HYH99912.1 hypothetical protein [Hyalangium sp.]
MDDQPTCGKGLAEHSALPAKLGELTAALAENLEIHMKALDLQDPNAREEYDAYVKVAKEHRDIATRLQAAAQQMARYRDLPMGRHDEEAMADPKALEAFEKFVRLEQELLALLQQWVERDRQMLGEIHGTGSSGSDKP